MGIALLSGGGSTPSEILHNGASRIRIGTTNVEVMENGQWTSITPVSVRQTVELGPVDTNGFASFGGSTGSTTVTASGTLYLNAANGMINRRGAITNPSWTGASTNGTMYAYLDIAADGSCTTGLSTLAPTYRWGGADVVTSGQFTFNIQEMTGKVGNGATAVQTYRVYVGEFVVSGGVVTAIVWYALMGRYNSVFGTIPAASTRSLNNHNLGIPPSFIAIDSYLKNQTSELNWGIGSIVMPVSSAVGGAPSGIKTAQVISSIGAQFAFETTLRIPDGSTGVISSVSTGNWLYNIVCRRTW